MKKFDWCPKTGALLPAFAGLSKQRIHSKNAEAQCSLNAWRRLAGAGELKLFLLSVLVAGAMAGVQAAPTNANANANADANNLAAQAWADLQTKAALNGVVQAAVRYEGNQTQVLVQSKRRYSGARTQTQVLKAAQLIQRDVAVFCGTHCQALPMPRPALDASGQLRFELRFQGLGRQLFQEELQALLLGSTALPAAARSGANAAEKGKAGLAPGQGKAPAGSGPAPRGPKTLPQAAPQRLQRPSIGV